MRFKRIPIWAYPLLFVTLVVAYFSYSSNQAYVPNLSANPVYDPTVSSGFSDPFETVPTKCDWCSVATGLFVVAENGAGKTTFIRNSFTKMLDNGFSVRPDLGEHAKEPLLEWAILKAANSSSKPIFFGSPNYFCLNNDHMHIRGCKCTKWRELHPTIYVKVVLPPYDIHLARIHARIEKKGLSHVTPRWFGRSNYTEELTKRQLELLECAKKNLWPVYSSFQDALAFETSSMPSHIRTVNNPDIGEHSEDV